MANAVALSDGSKATAHDAPSTAIAVGSGGKARARNTRGRVTAVTASGTARATASIASSDIDTSGDTATAADVLYGKTFHARGAGTEGTMPNRNGASGTITTVSGVYEIQDGYHDGTGTVSISSADQALLIAENIKAGVTILGVLGEHEGGSTATSQEKSVTPSDSVQVVVPDTGYDYLSQVTVAAITAMTSEEVTAAVEEGWTGGDS